MEVALLMIIVFGGFYFMYRVYGGMWSRVIFKMDNENGTPAHELSDGVDYVPTKKEVIFGHHFTSIAGTGPIVGPAIAIIWGWLPAVIWIFVGTVVMGAVHDFGALVMSMRHKGKSISEITGAYINDRTKFFFFIIVFLELLIIIAIFPLIIAVIFNMYPQSVFPVWIEIPIAMVLGWLIYKKGANVTLWSIIAVVLLYVSVWLGTLWEFTMPAMGAFSAVALWSFILFAYAFFASVLPVTSLLQPRDFINSHQLMVALALLVLGIIVTVIKVNDFSFVAPAVQLKPASSPPMWPFLFITIACGAISGFHSLVASGTSSKQIESENDAQLIGYGAMVMEGVLAFLVIIATAAGIGLGYLKDGIQLVGLEAWNAHYASWTAAAGLGSKITAFVVGSANMIENLGISHIFAITIMGVFVASFAGTTLDSATRIQRYIVTELFSDLKINLFQNKYVSTAFAVITAALLAFSTGLSGKGALTLWPLFGSVNQTLAALVLLVLTIYLVQKAPKYWLLTGIPALFMVIMTLWALIINQNSFMTNHNILLAVMNIGIIILVLAIVYEGVRRLLEALKAR